MCAYSVAWNESSPVGSSTNANTIDTEFHNLKISMRERMNQLLHSSTAWETDGDDPKLLDVLALAGTPELAVVHSAASLVVTTGSTDQLLWDTELIDTGTFHSTSTNSDRFTIVEAGYYRLRANIQVQMGANGGTVQLLMDKNGTLINSRQFDVPAADFASIGIDHIVLAAATDYYDLAISQSTGTSVTITGGATVSTFEIERINGTT